MMKVFLDTNIVIDLLDKREPFYIDAVELFTLAYKKEITLFVSPMTYATASYLLRKHGKEGMRKLLGNFRQLSQITTADEKVVDAALASYFCQYSHFIAERTVGTIIIPISEINKLSRCGVTTT